MPYNVTHNPDPFLSMSTTDDIEDTHFGKSSKNKLRYIKQKLNFWPNYWLVVHSIILCSEYLDYHKISQSRVYSATPSKAM